MSTRTIVNCFTLVVAVLIALGVWGWYASDDSRAEVLRLRDERRLEVFCQEYRGVADIERIYRPALIPESTTSSVPLDPNLPSTTLDPNLPSTTLDPNLPPTSSDPNLPPASSDFVYEPILLVDLERLERNAPSAVEEEVDIVVAAEAEMRQTGSPEIFDDPEVQRSVQRITDYGTSRCP